jgi:hypothetical protein
LDRLEDESDIRAIREAEKEPLYDQKEAEESVRRLSEEIKNNGLPSSIAPLIIGITGYGNVSRGAQDILDILPIEEISPEALLNFKSEIGKPLNKIYKVVFKEDDMYAPVQASEPFELQDYYDHPDKYKSIFHRYLPFLGILLNASFWDTAYPIHVTKKALKNIFNDSGAPNLRVIGDISCDVEGGVEATMKVTDPGNPVFIYNEAFNPDEAEVSDLKERYQLGRIGDVEVKHKLIRAINEFLEPIREQRMQFEKDADLVKDILTQGTQNAHIIARETIEQVRTSMGITNYLYSEVKRNNLKSHAHKTTPIHGLALV